MDAEPPVIGGIKLIEGGESNGDAIQSGDQGIDDMRLSLINTTFDSSACRHKPSTFPVTIAGLGEAGSFGCFWWFTETGPVYLT
jgi:hypothetical protein